MRGLRTKTQGLIRSIWVRTLNISTAPNKSCILQALEQTSEKRGRKDPRETLPNSTRGLSLLRSLGAPLSQPAPVTTALLLTCQRRAGRLKAELQEQPGTVEKHFRQVGLDSPPHFLRAEKNESGCRLDQC